MKVDTPTTVKEGNEFEKRGNEPTPVQRFVRPRWVQLLRESLPCCVEPFNEFFEDRAFRALTRS